MKLIRFEIGGDQFYGEISDKFVYQWSGAPWFNGKRLTRKYSLKEVY